jgi:GAF domain-containing protein
MTDTNLESQLEGLFSDEGLESEPEAEKSELQPEEAIIDFLVSEAGTATATIETPVAEAPPPMLAKPEKISERPHIPPASVYFREAVPRKQLTRVPGLLLHGVIILGGVLFVILLIRLIWQQPTSWPGFRAIYSAGYTVALVITLIQWMFSFYLSQVLRKAEEQQTDTIRSQALLKRRIDELATVNARLQKNTLQLQTAARVTQAVTSVLDPDELAQAAVKLVCERFDLYYVGLFLIDESGEWAVLRAGTGEAGQRMLAQDYRLKVDDTSMVGWCIANAQTHIAPDLGTIPHPSPAKVNPLLPETRSEISLPLRSRDRVIGALDVQSTDRAAFSQEDIAVLQMVADQVAVTIDNAGLLAELRAKLEKMEASQRRNLRERWAYSVSTQAGSSYERVLPGVPPLTDVSTSKDAGKLDQTIVQAMVRQEVVAQSDTGSGTGQAALVAPISLRGEVLGALGLHEPEGRRGWTDDEIALVEAIADQMALAIENARLLEETRQYAERERLIADISAQVRASTNVETILRTAIRELGRALRASDALIQLGVSDGADSPYADKGVVDDDGADA